MIITTEQTIKQFEFWSGAKDLAEKLTPQELDLIQFELEQLYPHGLKETELNDLFWFDSEFICELIGQTEEDIFNR